MASAAPHHEKSLDLIVFKVVIIGGPSVGKTQLLSRMDKNLFSEDYRPTVGLDFASKVVQHDGENIKMQLWDTAGRERFRSTSTAYYTTCKGIFGVFDVNNRASYEELQKMLDDYRRIYTTKLPIVILGNQVDTVATREVPESEAIQYCKGQNWSYFDTSAKTGFNVPEAFDHMLSEVYNYKLGDDTPKTVYASLSQGESTKNIPIVTEPSSTFNFSELFDSDQFSDVNFTHVPSNKHLRLHSSILKIHSIDDAVLSLLAKADVPENCLDRFFKPLYGDSSLFSPTFEESIMMVHVYSLQRLINSRILSQWTRTQLWSSISSSLSLSETILLLLEMLKYGSDDSLQVLAIEHLGKEMGGFLEHQELFADYARENALNFGILCFRIGQGEASDLSQGHHQYATTTPSQLLRDGLKELLRGLEMGNNDPARVLRGTTTPSANSDSGVGHTEEVIDPLPAVSVRIPGNFSLVIENEFECLAHDWVLATRWNFVKRLWASGAEEMKSRKLVFPPSTPPNFLRLALYSAYSGEFLDCHATSDACAFVLTQSAEYDIIDLPPPSTPASSSSSDPQSSRNWFKVVAKPGFTKMVAHCRKKVAEPLRANNIMNALLLRSQPGFEEDLQYAINYFAKTITNIPLSTENEVLLDQLPTEILRATLKQIMSSNETVSFK